MLHKKYIHLYKLQNWAKLPYALKNKNISYPWWWWRGGRVTRLKGSICLPTSKPNQMQIGVFSKESRGLLVEGMVPRP